MANKKYLIGNWKSNKTHSGVISFFQAISVLFNQSKDKLTSQVEAVICPSFLHLQSAYKLIKDLNIPVKLGAQDISPFGEGAFTGEINANQLQEFVNYTIIGHSERRNHLGETDNLLKLKVDQAKEWGIKSVFCVSDAATYIPENVSLIAYEPLFAIGSGKPDTPENANIIIKAIKKRISAIPVIYGGSVTSDNIKSFLQMEQIDGVLPGKSSLDPNNFYQMLINAAQ